MTMGVSNALIVSTPAIDRNFRRNVSMREFASCYRADSEQNYDRYSTGSDRQR